MSITDARHATLGAVIREQAEAYGDKPFLEFLDRTISYAELDALTNSVAHSLLGIGVSAGDRVCLMLPNCVEFVLTWFALAKIGAAEVPVNLAQRGEGLKHVLGNADASLLVTNQASLEHVARVVGETRIRDVVVVGDPANGRSLSPPPAMRPFSDLLGGPDAPPKADVRPTSLHSIMYTSGTTGLPKGVMITHRYFFHYSAGLADAVGVEADDRILMVLPLFHTNPQLFTYGALMRGATLVLRPGFSVSRFWNEVREHRATVIDCLGIMPTLLHKQPPVPNERDNPVRRAYIVPCPPEVYRSLTARYDMQITSSYGSTEANCPVHFTAGCDSAKAGSAGTSWGPIEFRIVDDDDDEVATGEVGEIVIRSHEPWTMFSGYYGNDAATVDAWRNLWFHSGDRGYVDEDGYLWFVDRKKEAIRKSGEMLSPAEVERTILEHDAVAECAVVGVPSELGDDDVKAVLVLAGDASVTPEEIIRFCEGKIAYFMVPRYVEIKDSLPKTPSERIEKYKLKEEGVTGRCWDRVAAGYEIAR